MNTRFDLTNYIIALGTIYSGSGAIYDYLSGRGDLQDPLQGTEYQLPQMPNGLMTLEAIAKNAFHPGTADYVLYQFEHITKKLSQSKTIWRHGKNYSTLLPLFDKAIREFTDEITAAELPMHLHWHKLIKSKSPIIHFIGKLKNRLGLKDKAPKTRLLVSHENLIDSAQKLHSKIFELNSGKGPVLLNNAGSGWNPIESTKYFLNRKIILVTRDPRDQFSELKQMKNSSNVEGFVKWYQEMQRRIKKTSHPNLFLLRFEDFVNQNEKMINEICNHVSLDHSVPSSYQAKLSKKNIGKYKEILNQKEITIIKNKLSEYLC